MQKNGRVLIYFKSVCVAAVLPPEIQVVPVNATAVNVTWANEGDTKVKGYTIHLRNLSADGSTTVIELPPETRHYVLSHLGKCSSHKKFAVAIDRVGGIKFLFSIFGYHRCHKHASEIVCFR